MNILTKISIVVLVVLSLFVSAVFITQASVVPNYAAMYRAADLRASANATEAANQHVLSQRLQQDLERVTGELGKAQADAKKGAQDAETNILALDSQLQAAKRDNVAQEGTLAKLVVTVGSQNDRLQANAAELTAARKANDQLAEENRRVTQQFQETSAQLERGNRQTEYYQEQIADLQKQIEEIRRTRGVSPVAGAGGTAVHVAGPGEETYTGSVTSVKDDLAGINIGSSNGVKKGDKLTVYRGGKFIAYLLIEQVDANNAAGIISDRQAEVAQGDKVTNKLQ